MQLHLSHYTSPIGQLLLVTDPDQTLRALDFADHQPRMQKLLRRHYPTHTLTQSPLPTSILTALNAYFAGNLAALNKIPTATNGTPFQRSVWKALRSIPPSTTLSYSQLAKQINHPSASRAVGAANSQNPIAIVVPCHRVIGKNGALTGFASGLQNKQHLLSHESNFSPLTS